jgi:nickel transport protein
MTLCKALSLVGAAALLLAPTAADAHGIETDLRRFDGLSSQLDFGEQRQGGAQALSPQAERFELRSQFSTGVPAVAASVRLVPPDGGVPIEVGRTDADGQIRFTMPPQAGDDWEIQVDAGPGHRDYLELSSVGEPAASLGQPPAPGRRPFRHAVGDLILSLRDTPVDRGQGVLLLGMLGGLGLGGLLWRRQRS